MTTHRIRTPMAQPERDVSHWIRRSDQRLRAFVKVRPGLKKSGDTIRACLHFYMSFNVADSRFFSGLSCSIDSYYALGVKLLVVIRVGVDRTKGESHFVIHHPLAHSRLILRSGIIFGEGCGIRILLANALRSDRRLSLSSVPLGAQKSRILCM